MSEKLNQWLARISLASFKEGTDQPERGKLVGTGFVTTYPWLVTCNHVVTSCIFGKSSTDTVEPGLLKTLVIDFPFSKDLCGKLFTAELITSCPNDKQAGLNDIFDIAVLSLKPLIALDSNETEALASTWKYETNHEFYADHKVKCKGFHIEKGSLLEGESKSVCADGLIELDLSIDETIGGASGAPVWSDDEQAIIGMLISQRGERAQNFKYKKVYMTPMYKVVDACETHKEALLKHRAKYGEFKQIDDEVFWDDIKFDLEGLLEGLPASLLKNWSRKQRWKEDQIEADLLHLIIETTREDIGKLLRNFTTSVSRELRSLERAEKYRPAKILLDDAKRLVSMLSLYSLEEKSAKALRDVVKHTSGTLNIRMSHDLPGCAELASAARMQSVPSYRRHKSKPMVQGKYAVSHFDLEVGFQDGWIDEVGKEVWRVFFPRYSPDEYSREYLRNYIRRELVADNPEKKNCYLVVSVNPRDKNESPLLDKKHRQAFTEIFPELPIVVLDKAMQSGAYITSDYDLMIELHNFYEKVDAYDTTIARETERKTTG